MHRRAASHIQLAGVETAVPEERGQGCALLTPRDWELPTKVPSILLALAQDCRCNPASELWFWGAHRLTSDSTTTGCKTEAVVCLLEGLVELRVCLHCALLWLILLLALLQPILVSSTHKYGFSIASSGCIQIHPQVVQCRGAFIPVSGVPLGFQHKPRLNVSLECLCMRSFCLALSYVSPDKVKLWKQGR